jgi:hypothetical protein
LVNSFVLFRFGVRGVARSWRRRTTQSQRLRQIVSIQDIFRGYIVTIWEVPRVDLPFLDFLDTLGLFSKYRIELDIIIRPVVVINNIGVVLCHFLFVT